MKTTEPLGCLAALLSLLAWLPRRVRAFVRNHVDRTQNSRALEYYVYLGEHTFTVILGPKCPECHGTGGGYSSEIEPGWTCWYCDYKQRVSPWRWAWYYVRWAWSVLRHAPELIWPDYIQPALERRRRHALRDPHWPPERRP